MGVTIRTQGRAQLAALAIGALGALAVATWSEPAPAIEDATDAMAAAAPFLEQAPAAARRAGERWEVRAGQERAWIDARTGELVEVSFPPSR